MTPLQFPAEVRRDPFPFYAQLRAHSPVVQQGSVWALFDYDGVKRALTDSEAFSSAASPKGSAPASWLIFTDPPRHSKLRALIGRAFTPRTVANLEPRIRALSRELLEPILSRGETDDFVSAFASPLPLMVIAELLGADPAGWRRFRGWSEAIWGSWRPSTATRRASARPTRRHTKRCVKRWKACWRRGARTRRTIC